MAMVSRSDFNGSIAVEYAEQRKAVKGRGIYYAIFANGPTDFYVASESDWIQSLQFTQEMEQLYMQQNAYMLDENCLHVGFPVAARYLAGDLAWYRGKLIEFDDKKGNYKIEFVDFAHEQVNNFDQLRALPAKMGEYPPMALHCRLLGAETVDNTDPNVATNFCLFVFRGCNKGKCIVDFLTDTPPQYIVRVWNAETGEELLPEILGPLKQICSTASASVASSVSPKPNVVVDENLNSVARSFDNVVDLMLMTDNVSSGARNKTTHIQETNFISNPVTENGVHINDCAENDDGSGFDFLGDIVQKLKRQCKVDGQATTMTAAENFRRKFSSPTIPAAKPPVPKRDAATQTSGVLQPNNLLKLETTMGEFFPNLSSLLMNS